MIGVRYARDARGEGGERRTNLNKTARRIEGNLAGHPEKKIDERRWVDVTVTERKLEVGLEEKEGYVKEGEKKKIKKKRVMLMICFLVVTLVPLGTLESFFAIRYRRHQPQKPALAS